MNRFALGTFEVERVYMRWNCSVYAIFCFLAFLPFLGLWAQYTYQGPNQPVPGNPQLVRIEVLVRDSAQSAGVAIKSVTFNGQVVPLKPRDIYGNRGSSSFQLPPGEYSLLWVVQKDKFAWPRQATHEEKVTVSPRDLWLQISIEGDEASIR
ncbi:MAG: hypothetical protein HY861_03630 [Chlamydiia bacterium]|nr:hypothetical protein [Chlamydiia bacterium]